MREHLYCHAVSRLYCDRPSTIRVIIIAFTDLYLNALSHFSRLKEFFTYIFSVDARIKRNMLLFDRHLYHQRAIKTQNPLQNFTPMYYKARTTPLANARGTGEAAAAA
jgi:hypothetical protein